MGRQPVLEIIAVDADDARAAEAGGADRIELVSAMSEAGLTPSYGMIEQVVSSVSIPVYVMIRPHSRSFRYKADEIRAMARDIRAVREIGAAGIVIGALTEQGELDEALFPEWIAEAKGLGITFHRAIDESANVLRTLEAVAQFPEIERVLTSGGKRTAPEAIGELRELSELGRKLQVRVMAGSGLTVGTLRTFVLQSGIAEVHLGSGVRLGGTFQNAVDPSLVSKAKQLLAEAAKEIQ